MCRRDGPQLFGTIDLDKKVVTALPHTVGTTEKSSLMGMASTGPRTVVPSRVPNELYGILRGGGPRNVRDRAILIGLVR